MLKTSMQALGAVSLLLLTSGYSAFGAGDDLQNFDSTGAMSFTITFESHTTHPGGIIEVPVSFHIDHVGWYVGAQSIAINPDINGDGIVDTADLGILLGLFGTSG